MRLTGEEWGELRSALHSGAMLSPALIERCLEDEECWPMWRAARPPERSPEAYAYLSGEGGLRPESARWLVLGGEEMRAWWRVVGDDTSPLATLKGETICEEVRETVSSMFIGGPAWVTASISQRPTLHDGIKRAAGGDVPDGDEPRHFAVSLKTVEPITVTYDRDPQAEIWEKVGAHLLDAAGADLLVTSVQAITINQAREMLEHGRGEGGSPIRGAGRRLPDEVELVAWGVRLSREELIRRMPWRREG